MLTARISLIGIALALIPFSLSFGKLSDAETFKIIDMIVASQKAEMTNLKEGAGTCQVITKSLNDANNPVTQQYKVDFSFKGLSTRTDFFHNDSSGLAVLSHSIADNGEFFYRYNKAADGALVKKSAVNSGRREIASDFHANTYYGFVGNIPMYEFLEKSKKTCNFQLSFTKEGLLELTSKYGFDSDGNASASAATDMYYVLFDPAHSYRPIKWTYEQKNVGFQKEYHKWERSITWNDSSPYPVSVVQYETHVNSPERLAKMANGNIFAHSSNYQVHIENIKFTPDAQVSDETFTLKGMGLANSTIIDDTTTGILYTFGIPKIDETLLDNMLADKVLPSKCTSQANTVSSSKCVSQTNTPQLPSPITQMDKSASIVNSSRILRFSIWTVPILVLSVLLVWVILRKAK